VLYFISLQEQVNNCQQNLHPDSGVRLQRYKMSIEHGKCYISVDGDIITVKAVGAFNSEGIVKTIKELESVIESFGQKDFKWLFDYSETEGGTPDVFNKINECNIWLNNQNIIAKAIVINSPTNLEILASIAPAISAQNTRNFDDKASAMDWLRAESPTNK